AFWASCWIQASVGEPAASKTSESPLPKSLSFSGCGETRAKLAGAAAALAWGVAGAASTLGGGAGAGLQPLQPESARPPRASPISVFPGIEHSPVVGREIFRGRGRRQCDRWGTAATPCKRRAFER